jgi:hypothetical protein
LGYPKAAWLAFGIALAVVSDVTDGSFNGIAPRPSAEKALETDDLG